MPLPAPLPRSARESLRWTARRKAEIVVAVERGRLTPQRACTRYGISQEELDGWIELYERHGLAGLSTTKTQHFRSPAAPTDVLKAMDASGLTDSQIARFSAIALGTLVNWRSGKHRPSPSTAAMVMRVLARARR
jgi:transposase-like protein